MAHKCNCCRGEGYVPCSVVEQRARLKRTDCLKKKKPVLLVMDEDMLNVPHVTVVEK